MQQKIKDNKESQFAQYLLIQWLIKSSRKRSAREILDYLHENTEWGARELQAGKPANSKRKLEIWLKDLTESPEFGQIVKCEQGPYATAKRMYHASAGASDDKTMQIEDACFLGLAQRFLDVTMPADLVTASLEEMFHTASAQLRQYGQSTSAERRGINAYVNRISVVPRGLELYRDKVPYEVLAVISRAILKGKCIRLQYKGNPRWRIFHPCGIVVREPKIYCLAVDDADVKGKRFEQANIKQLLCNRIESPQISGKFNRVPEAFKTQSYIRRGGIEIPLADGEPSAQRSFTLKLLFHGGTDNLRLDLEEFPISRQQTIEDEPGTGNFILTAAGMHQSEQLVEWILGRMERVEVLAPARLRARIARRIAKMHERYLG